ncbi:hypothetical protein H477_6001 [[Clostridium] sordellii ATCC 9714]|nr:hypothetical protein H477_6001 [[Clostridium] sordellii ATCC 9714] [Paeniclostridium sordellii ATCC 9714]
MDSLSGSLDCEYLIVNLFLSNFLPLIKISNSLISFGVNNDPLSEEVKTFLSPTDGNISIIDKSLSSLFDVFLILSL